MQKKTSKKDELIFLAINSLFELNARADEIDHWYKMGKIKAQEYTQMVDLAWNHAELIYDILSSHRKKLPKLLNARERHYAKSLFDGVEMVRAKKIELGIAEA